MLDQKTSRLKSKIWKCSYETHQSIISNLFLLIGVSPNAHSEIELTNALARDIGKAYGFYLSQNHSLSQISKKYPELARRALLAEREFDGTFRSSIEKMDDLMQRNAKDEWGKVKRQLETQIAGSVKY